MDTDPLAVLYTTLSLRGLEHGYRSTGCAPYQNLTKKWSIDTVPLALLYTKLSLRGLEHGY